MLKFARFLFPIIILFLIIGAVSAGENVTSDDSLQVNETEPVALESEAVEEVVIPASEEVNVSAVEESEVIGNDSDIIADINVTFEGQMWEENLSDISVELPEEAEGEFRVTVNDKVIYNQTITEKSFNVPIQLPKSNLTYIAYIWPPVDSKTYMVNAFYNDINLNINRELQVMKCSPDSRPVKLIPEEILQHGDTHSMAIVPRSSNGMMELYIDDRLSSRFRVTGPYLQINYTELAGLKLGKHTFRAKYFNDTYYHDYDMTYNFTVVRAVINIPQTVNISHDSCISVSVLKNVKGTVKVYIDGVLVSKESLTDGEYILCLEKYLKRDSKEVRVEFSSDKFTRSKTQKINVTYDLEVYGYLDFVYGEDNIIEIYLPDYLNNKLLKVEINGTKYKFARPAYTGNNMVEVNVSKLLAGSYSMFISYPGDARFKAKSKTVNFTVRYETISPYDAVYGDNCYVKLYLPKDAKGTLNLYVDGKLYKSAKVTNGKALINLKGIREGHHMINATYAGDDYDVSPSSSSLFVRFKFKIAYTFTAGEKKYVSVQVSKSSKGYVIFYIDDSPHRVNVKNGIARYSLKGLREGEYEITADYFDEEGFADSEYAVITVYEPRLKIVSSKLYVSGANVKVKVLNNNKKPMAKVYVKIRLNGRNYWVKTNKKGIATVKKSLKLKAKKYRLTVSCNGAKISKVIKAKHIISLKSVKVKKSAKRLVITAKVITKFKKGSKVTFKFNGKTYKAKLNRNGIAKLTIKKQVLKKLRAGAKVRYQATYLKDTVKRTAKVKR